MMTEIMPHYLIVGLGVTGWSCIQCLEAEGYTLEVADTRLNPLFLEALQEKYPDILCHLGRLPIERLPCLEGIIVSPGLDTAHPFFVEARALGVPVMGDIDLFRARVAAPMIGITGTNGKSTVTTLVGAFLNAAGIPALIGGNVGIPALELLNQPIPEVYVLELSSYQLDLIHFLPLLSATILNIAPDHLDRYGTLMRYQQSKQRIYAEAGLAVINRIDHATKPLINVGMCSFGRNPSEGKNYGIQVVNGERWFAQGTQRLCKVSDAKLQGAHNEENILAAMALISSFEITAEVFCTVLQHFEGLPHRCQMVLQHNDVTWVNDSKGTNVAATLAAIQALKPLEGRFILILGGKPKKEDYQLLVPAVLNTAAAVIVMGEASDLLYAIFNVESVKASGILVHKVTFLEEAVERAASTAEAGDTVLFSPACPSLDQYQNYEERGQDFIRQVQALVACHV